MSEAPTELEKLKEQVEHLRDVINSRYRGQSRLDMEAERLKTFAADYGRFIADTKSLRLSLDESRKNWEITNRQLRAAMSEIQKISDRVDKLANWANEQRGISGKESS